MIRLVVANEERTDQRKRFWWKHNCQTDAPFEGVVRCGLRRTESQLESCSREGDTPLSATEAPESPLPLESR